MAKCPWRKCGAAFFRFVVWAMLGVTGGMASAQPVGSAASAASSTPGATTAIRLHWQPVPRTSARLTAAQLGLVINENDPYSVAVGAAYARQRGLTARQILRVQLPVQARLEREAGEALKARVDAYFGPGIQALALAWARPFAVQCQSITGVLALGFDPGLCEHTCGPAKRSPYYNTASARPWTDFGMRPSMLLAASGGAEAERLIERGVAADGTLGLRGGLPVQAYFMVTSDAKRSVRVVNFPPPGRLAGAGVDIHVQSGELPHPRALVPPEGAASSGDLSVGEPARLLLVQTGAARLPDLSGLPWVPGALADHLTSFGGVLDDSAGQTSALAWIASGATASYGTVSEPCNHQQKFPHPQLLLLHYLQGATALEAYWKSVMWPQQGVFVGEPLAAPFARRSRP